MIVGRVKQCVLWMAMIFVTGSNAWAQPWDGVPSGQYSDAMANNPYDVPPPVERNEVNDYIDWSPLTGVFFRYDRLYSLMTPPRATVLGDPGTTYLARHDDGGVVAYSATLDTSWIDSNGGWGDRFEFGREDEYYGWMIGIINLRQRDTFAFDGALVTFTDPGSLLTGFRDVNVDGIDDDLDGDGIYGSSGQDTSAPLDGVIDTSAPPDPNDLVQYLPTFTNLVQTQTTTLTGVDILPYFNQPGFFDIGVLNFYGGARFLRVTDNYHAVGTGGVLDGSYWDSNVDNYLIGPEIGVRWTYRYAFVTATTEARGMSAYNRQHARLTGTFASNHTSTSRPTQITPTSFNQSFERDEFSPYSEWRAEVVLSIIDGLSMRFAYTGMYMGGISRAAPKIDYTLPALGYNMSDSDTGLFVNSFGLGVQLEF